MAHNFGESGHTNSIWNRNVLPNFCSVANEAGHVRHERDAVVPGFFVLLERQIHTCYCRCSLATINTAARGSRRCSEGCTCTFGYTKAGGYILDINAYALT